MTRFLSNSTSQWTFEEISARLGISTAVYQKVPLGARQIAELRWGEVFAALKDIDYRGELVFEDGRGENPEEWIRMAVAFPQAFVQRYGS